MWRYTFLLLIWVSKSIHTHWYYWDCTISSTDISSFSPYNDSSLHSWAGNHFLVIKSLRLHIAMVWLRIKIRAKEQQTKRLLSIYPLVLWESLVQLLDPALPTGPHCCFWDRCSSQCVAPQNSQPQTRNFGKRILGETSTDL